MKPKILIEEADFIQVGKSSSQLERITMQIAINQQTMPLYTMNQESFKICIDKAREFILQLDEAEKEIKTDGWVKK